MQALDAFVEDSLFATCVSQIREPSGPYPETPFRTKEPEVHTRAQIEFRETIPPLPPLLKVEPLMIPKEEPAKVESPEVIEPAKVESPEVVQPTEVESPEVIQPAKMESPEVIQPAKMESPEVIEPAKMESPEVVQPAEVESPEVVQPAITVLEEVHPEEMKPLVLSKTPQTPFLIMPKPLPAAIPIPQTPAPIPPPEVPYPPQESKSLEMVNREWTRFLKTQTVNSFEQASSLFLHLNHQLKECFNNQSLANYTYHQNRHEVEVLRADIAKIIPQASQFCLESHESSSNSIQEVANKVHENQQWTSQNLELICERLNSVIQTTNQSTQLMREIHEMREINKELIARLWKEESMGKPAVVDEVPMDFVVEEFTSNPTGEPLVESVKEPLVEPAKEPLVEPTNEPLVGPAVEPAQEEATKVDPAVEPIMEPALEPVNEPAVEPAKQESKSDTKRRARKGKGK